MHLQVVLAVRYPSFPQNAFIYTTRVNEIQIQETRGQSATETLLTFVRLNRLNFKRLYQLYWRTTAISGPTADNAEWFCNHNLQILYLYMLYVFAVNLNIRMLHVLNVSRGTLEPGYVQTLTDFVL